MSVAVAAAPEPFSDSDDDDLDMFVDRKVLALFDDDLGIEDDLSENSSEDSSRCLVLRFKYEFSLLHIFLHIVDSL